MEPLKVVNVTRCKINRSKNTPVLDVSQEYRRRIRTQARRDFRQKEKQRISNGTSPLYIGPPSYSQSIGETNEAPEELLSVVAPPSRIPSTINAHDLWRDSFARSMTEDCYPRHHNSMHVLENNIAFLYAMKCNTPMRAIREALSLLHIGSTSGNDNILHEGRKRCVYAISCLREEAAQKKPTMTVLGLTMVGMGILLCQVYAAVSESSSSNTWQSHIAGISALVSTNRLEIAHSAQESFLVQQIGVVQLVHSLCTRKPFPGGLPVRAMSTRSGKVNFLLDLAFRVPPLLEEIDSANGIELRTSDSRLLRDLLALKETFESWLKSFCIVTRLDQEDASREGKSSIHDLTCESLCRICLLLVVESITEHESCSRPERPPTFNPEKYASQLRETATLFTEVTKIPIVKARGASGPLHFLGRYYFQTRDIAGIKWCLQLKESLCREAPYLSWDVMLPWSFLTLYAIPLRTTEMTIGTALRALI